MLPRVTRVQHCWQCQEAACCRRLAATGENRSEKAFDTMYSRIWGGAKSESQAFFIEPVTVNSIKSQSQKEKPNAESIILM